MCVTQAALLRLNRHLDEFYELVIYRAIRTSLKIYIHKPRVLTIILNNSTR